jgi:ubiquitin-activating enzyme E1
MVNEQQRHSFKDGDYVRFKEVEGMPEINQHAQIRVKNCEPYGFTLELDTSSYGEYKL